MYDFLNELEWAFAENDMDVLITCIEGNTLSLIDMSGKKASLKFTTAGIVFFDNEKCYIKTFGYSDNDRGLLIDYVLLYFENKRKRCRDLLTTYREDKQYTKEAFILLLQNIDDLDYLNGAGKHVLCLLQNNNIDFEKNIIGVHRMVLSMLKIESINDWNYFFGKKEYQINLEKGIE